MYLLDTDTIIYSLKGNSAIAKNLEQHVEDPMRISVITIMELYFGAYKSQKFEANIAKVRTIEQTFEILAADKEIAGVFGAIKASLQKSGTPLDDFDLIISATALAHNLVLVTNNEGHFGRIEGLKLANWSVYPAADFAH
jgi:predicted nucleic acid-binding protein